MEAHWIYTPYAAVLHLTAMLSLVVAILILIRRQTIGAGTFSLLMFAVAEWAGAAGFEAAAVSVEEKILWAKIEYVGAVLVPTLFLIFALEYRQSHHFLSPRYILFYSIVPLTVLVMTITNEFHALIWTGFIPGPSGLNVILYQHGIGFYFLSAYDYLLALISVVVLASGLRQTKSKRSPYAGQVYFLLLSALFPIVVGLLYILGVNPFPGLDITPISFFFTGFFALIGVFRFGLFRILPVARHAVIEYMEDGVLVVDSSGLLADINPAAEKYLGVQASHSVGYPIEQVVPKWCTLPCKQPDLTEVQAELKTDEVPPRYFDVRIRPLYERKHMTGRLIVLRDITERRKAEKELQRQNEELNIINHISLAVTTGLDMEQTIKTLHEQCSLIAPIDIFYVALYDETRALVTVPVYYERGQYKTGLVRDINENPGSLGNIIRMRRTLYLRDAIRPVTRPLNLPPENEKVARSYIGIPLMVRDKVVGVMVLQSYRPLAYQENQIRLLERIAIHAAIAIENARLYAEVQRLAIMDELTHIYNYRALLELGKREVERARRFNHPLAVLFFDIDNFRDFNNRFSHSIGNIVLQEVVRVVSDALRSVDVFSRYGGDEFVIFLPETDLNAAYDVARRIYEQVASTKISTLQGELGVTLSIGIAALGPDTPDLNTLIEHANQAEHAAKASGTGISVYQDTGTPE